jgi:hypothetical protein
VAPIFIRIDQETGNFPPNFPTRRNREFAPLKRAETGNQPELNREIWVRFAKTLPLVVMSEELPLRAVSHWSAFLLAFLFQTHARTAAVLVGELDTRQFKRLANGGLVRGRNRDLTLDDFNSADSCHANF